MSDEELQDIYDTILIIEEIQTKRADEMDNLFPLGTDERTHFNEIVGLKSTISNKIGNQPPIDEYHPNYNLYLETQTEWKNETNELDGALGLITYPLKLLLLLPGLLGQAIMSVFKIGYGTEGSQAWLTIDNILFNQLALTDINIFSRNVYLISGTNADIIESQASGTLLPMRESIANWYYAFRNLAIVLSLLMLIYIGIKIALTNIAEKKAEYKNMLINWFTGFGLIFILHYIIIIVININNSVIQILARANLNPDNSKYENLMNQLFEQSWWIDFTVSWASAILYVVLVIITFIMLIMFIKRLITVSILVIVSPLISITYSIDKSGDNKSQVVDTWLKEFIYNVFIQIAYAVSYLVFGKISMDLACTDILDFGAIFLAVLSMLSMFLGVNIIKQIFGFDKASNLVQQLAMGAVISKTVSNVKKGIKDTKGFVENRSKQKQEAQNQEELRNVPKYAPSGKSTEELVNKIRKEKADKELREKMEVAQSKRDNRKIPKRPLRNASNAVSTPARIYKQVLNKAFHLSEIETGARNIVDKINNKLSGKQEITVSATEIFNELFHDYVSVEESRLGSNMTAEQFEQNIERINNTQFSELNVQDASLKRTLYVLEQRHGTQQAQNIISHFKDEKWGTNGTNS